MNQKKNSVTLGLIVSSIVLLLALQVFWLKSAYQDAADDFRKETNSLFRNIIFAMHDSLIQRSIEPMSGDSSMQFMKPRRLRIDESIHMADNPPPDSVINYININERSARVEVFMSRDNQGDSLQRFLRPLVKKMQSDNQAKGFVLRLVPDSLKKDSIKFHYEQALGKAGIRTPFKILALRAERGEQFEKAIAQRKDTLLSEVIRLGPVSRYAVLFPNIEGLLLKEITPQILFSVFLTLLTIGSFYLMYRSLRTQQRLMQIKNDFISNVTHELKTPVATMSVALEALKNFNALENPKRTSEYLEIAQNELSRLTLMTDKILKTALFEDQGVDLHIKKVDLDSMIQEILSSMKLVLEKRKTQLSYQKEGIDFAIEGSQDHLTNVVYNLLDNALKYSAEGSSIHISLKETADELTLSIKDNGVGIPLEYRKKIFEKFFRVPSGDVHTTKGYGLGLSYVASAVKSHQGEIRVDSEPGKGSRFIIILPKQHEN